MKLAAVSELSKYPTKDSFNKPRRRIKVVGGKSKVRLQIGSTAVISRLGGIDIQYVTGMNSPTFFSACWPLFYRH